MPVSRSRVIFRDAKGSDGCMRIIDLVIWFVGKAKAIRLAISRVKDAFSIISQKPDSALAIAQKGLRQSQRTGNKRLAANAYKTGGWAWLHKGVYDKAFSYLLQGKDLFRQLHEGRDVMSMYINLGMAYSMRSQFSTSARYLFMADSLTEKIA